MIILSIVFLIVWGSTAFLFWVERAARIEAEIGLRQALSNTQMLKQAVAAITQRAQRLDQPEVVAEKIRPFVESARALERSGDQKRMAVLLEFLKAHPGTSVAAAEFAIERVLAESHAG